MSHHVVGNFCGRAKQNFTYAAGSSPHHNMKSHTKIAVGRGDDSGRNANWVAMGMAQESEIDVPSRTSRWFACRYHRTGRSSDRSG